VRKRQVEKHFYNGGTIDDKWKRPKKDDSPWEQVDDLWFDNKKLYFDGYSEGGEYDSKSSYKTYVITDMKKDGHDFPLMWFKNPADGTTHAEATKTRNAYYEDYIDELGHDMEFLSYKAPYEFLDNYLQRTTEHCNALSEDLPYRHVFEMDLRTLLNTTEPPIERYLEGDLCGGIGQCAEGMSCRTGQGDSKGWICSTVVRPSEEFEPCLDTADCADDLVCQLAGDMKKCMKDDGGSSDCFDTADCADGFVCQLDGVSRTCVEESGGSAPHLTAHLRLLSALLVIELAFGFARSI